MAATVEKVSVAIGLEELEWARGRAAREGTSLSAVLTEAVRRARQDEAAREVLGWLVEGQAPVTSEELDEVGRQWKG